jgi:hypothetical protein
MVGGGVTLSCEVSNQMPSLQSEIWFVCSNLMQLSLEPSIGGHDCS